MQKKKLMCQFRIHGLATLALTSSHSIGIKSKIKQFGKLILNCKK